MNSSILSLIEKKKNNEPLEEKEIESFIASLTTKKAPPDYQIASLMAFIYFKGMTLKETAALTRAMRYSGAQFKYKGFPKDAKFVDKHSTGGVGDKITLPLAALVTSCDERIHYPTITGRGLGHTGGTVDKLESIPGLKTGINLTKFYKILKDHRLCFMSQTKDITPADKILYHLRDVTGTVESIPLITASILSKKLSETLDYFLLDIKYGSGAFLPSDKQIMELSKAVLDVLEHEGLHSSIYVTSMDTPLGDYSGNRVEVEESLAILRGEGPPSSTTLTYEFAARILSGIGIPINKAKDLIQAAIQSGDAYETFEKVVSAQGGSLKEFEKAGKRTKLKYASIQAVDSGYVKFNVRKLGLALVELGGGRKRKDDKIDVHVGLYHPVDTGDRVEKGQEIIRIMYRDKTKLANCRKILKNAISIEEESIEKPQLIRRVLNTSEEKS